MYYGLRAYGAHVRIPNAKHVTHARAMAAYASSSSPHSLLARQIRSPFPKPLFFITPPIFAYNRSISVSPLRFSSGSLIRQGHILHARSSMADKVESQYKGNGKSTSSVFPTEEELAVSLAEYVADLSQKFTTERGAFTVVVSGGSLIKSLRKLTESPYASSVDWSRWHVFWVDERVVPKDHADSNYKLAYDGFLSKVPIPPGNVYAINDALSAEGAADDYETCLKHLVTNGVVATSQASGFPKFDLMLLGMGPDGHVASLFPGHPLLQESKKWVTFIKDSPKPPPERITFTFPVINSSAYIAMVVCGAGKAGPVSAALNQADVSFPVQMVSPEGELAWFLDQEAASKL